MNTTSCFQVSPTVRASITGDGLVLLDVRSGQLLTANAVGAEIWRLAQARRTSQEIAGRLAERYGISLALAHRDVVAFLGTLLSRGLLAEEPESSAS